MPEPTTAQQLAQFRADLTAANLPADEIAHAMQRAIDALVHRGLIVSEPEPDTPPATECDPIWPTVPIVLRYGSPGDWVRHLRGGCPQGPCAFAIDAANQIAAHSGVKS